MASNSPGSVFLSINFGLNTSFSEKQAYCSNDMGTTRWGVSRRRLKSASPLTFRHSYARVLRRSDADNFSRDGNIVEILPGDIRHCRIGELDQGRVFLVVENLDSNDISVDAEQREQFVGIRSTFFQIGHEKDAALYRRG